MICPHCGQTIRYKERSGMKCPKCKGEFVFEPKENSLKVTDKGFRNAVSKLSDNGKYFFTNGQAVHFLSRKKITNSFHTYRGLMIIIAFIATIIVAVLSQSILIAAILAVIFIGIIAFYWKVEGDLTLPAPDINLFASLGKWKRIYKEEPQMIAGAPLSLESLNLNDVRGVLVCPEKDVLACLTANGAAEKLGLILINSTDSRSRSDESKFNYIIKRPDLPIFVLHDASVDGCYHRDEFAEKYFKGDKQRRVYDIGLRPKMTMNTKLMRLRLKPVTDAYKNLQWLEPDEIAWLAKGNYTPLLALTPAQLIKFVTSAVERRYKQIGQTSEIKEAQSFGFMTWVGQ